MTRTAVIATTGLAVLVGAALVWGIGRWRRCHAAPLTRAEALQHAEARLERYAQSRGWHVALPGLRDAVYDGRANSWRVTFQNMNCSVVVVTDRCHDDAVGPVDHCP